jgi:hypothetical protein
MSQGVSRCEEVASPSEGYRRKSPPLAKLIVEKTEGVCGKALWTEVEIYTQTRGDFLSPQGGLRSKFGPSTQEPFEPLRHSNAVRIRKSESIIPAVVFHDIAFHEPSQGVVRQLVRPHNLRAGKMACHGTSNCGTGYKLIGLSLPESNGD